MIRLYGQNTCMAKYFPKSIKAIDESGLGAVTIMLSQMAPGQLIPPHQGPAKFILRYLMGLKVPKPDGPDGEPPFLHVWDCGRPQDVEECPLKWRHEWTYDGQEVIWDDSFYHESSNPTSGERIAIFMDVKRHDWRGWRERLISEIVLWFVKVLPVARKGEIVKNTNAICDREMEGTL